MTDGAHQDLNLVPYMDVLVNLMLFLLVVTAYFVDVRSLRVDASGVGDDPPSAGPPAVIVSLRGDTVEVRGGPGEPVLSLPIEDGRMPWGCLDERLRQLKDAGGVHTTLSLTADRDVPYKTVVATLDAVRDDARGPLFPGVQLGVIAR